MLAPLITYPVAFGLYESSVPAPPLGLAVNEAVSVNGRVGRVLGFYARATETVLVYFGPGDCVEYPAADLRREAPLTV